MAISLVNNLSMNRSDAAVADDVWTATSATLSDFQAAAGGGKIGQVVHAAKTDSFTVQADATWSDVTDLTVTTGSLASTSSKVLVMASVQNMASNNCAWKVVDGAGADITGFIGDAAGSRIRSTSGSLYESSTVVNNGPFTSIALDSPASTAAQTYKVQVYTIGNDITYVNRSRGDSDSGSYFRNLSTITAMEILA